MTEHYEAILARSIVMNEKKGILTEAEQAAKLATDLASQLRHDRFWRDEFLTVSEQHKISRTLARKLGHPEPYDPEEFE